MPVMSCTFSKYHDVFQKLLKAEANRRVRMCNLQSAKDCASVKTSLATVHARAQEMGKARVARSVGLYTVWGMRTDHVAGYGKLATRRRWR